MKCTLCEIIMKWSFRNRLKNTFDSLAFYLILVSDPPILKRSRQLQVQSKSESILCLLVLVRWPMGDCKLILQFRKCENCIPEIRIPSVLPVSRRRHWRFTGSWKTIWLLWEFDCKLGCCRDLCCVAFKIVARYKVRMTCGGLMVFGSH